MDGKSNATDPYAGLRPFYQLCWLGLGCSLLALLLVSGNLRARTLGSFVPFLPGVVVVVLAAGVGLLFRRRARATQNSVEATAHKSETDRLRRKLDLVRDKTRKLSNVGDLDVLLVPGNTVNAWVARSRQHPLIQITSAFWSVYQGSAELDGALAHEAGHVVARDVEHFHGLYYLAGIVGGAWTLFVPIALAMLVATGGARAASSLLVVAGTIGFSAMAVACTWSALLVARELQADAFAATALGDAKPLRMFLQRQQELRLKGHASPSLVQTIWRWVVQPDLGWRMSFPVLRGTVGSRVEWMLGFGVFGALMVPYWSVFLTKGMLENYQADQPPEQTPLSPAWLLILAASIAVFWVVYQFLWHRNRSAGRDTTLLSTLRAWARLSLPSTVLVVLLLLALSCIEPTTGGTRARLDCAQWLMAVMALPLIWLTLWAAATLAMVWEGPRRAPRPGLLHAAAAIAAVVAPGAIGVLILGVLFQQAARNPNSPLAAAGGLVAGPLVASLTIGSWAHWKLNRRRRANADSG